ncbi:helix-turn-helix domain-containing protein [Paracoccus sp. TOH]|uniref:helix-turn-helix domain-containing protein n=1 Tax=Paracoccus sp. TOH TaxID=1263728 RepID=UPI0025B1F5A2|nr:helix-turn-helix domain-containing protein [Paracoccus sp. TOH]WJS84812.1 helix-turn-helix domain-containing protein [Paracoccus sp. TOH]
MVQQRRQIADLVRQSDVKTRLREAGSGISAIKPSSVTVVSQGYRRSENIQRAIAEKLGTTPEKIWPDRYEQEGNMSK